MKRTDFRPNNSSSMISAKDRAMIKKERNEVANTDYKVEYQRYKNAGGKEDYNTFYKANYQSKAERLRDFDRGLAIGLNAGNNFSNNLQVKKQNENRDHSSENIEYLDYVESNNASEKYVKVQGGYGDYTYEKYSKVVDKDGTTAVSIERNALGYPVLYDKSGKDAYMKKEKPQKPTRDYSSEYEGKGQDKVLNKDTTKGKYNYELIEKRNGRVVENINADNKKEAYNKINRKDTKNFKLVKTHYVTRRNKKHEKSEDYNERYSDRSLSGE